MGTASCYENSASDTLESYHAVFDPRTHVFSFIPTSQKNLYFTKCIFFSPLTIATPPYSFRKSPPPLPSTRRSTMWPDRSTKLNNTAQSILAAASRKSPSPLLQPSEPSITSKQVQNMVLHLQHWHCFLTTQIPAEFLLFPISMATVYFFSSSQLLNWSRIPMLL